MLEAIYKLWIFDMKARRRFQIQTILIAFAYGIFNSMALGRPETRVTWETLGLICVLTTGFTLFYCVRIGPGKIRSAYSRLTEFLQNRSFLGLGLTSAIMLVVISFVAYVPNGKVQAYSLNLQLRQAASTPELNATDVNRIGKLFATAKARQAPLNPELVGVAATKLLDKSRSNADAWPAALSVLSYHSSLNKDSSALPRQSCFTAGTVHAVIGFTIICDYQELDNIDWKNDVFENTLIVYRGGPTKLENVSFKNCRFEISYTAAGLKLGQLMLASNSVSLSVPDEQLSPSKN